MNSAVDLTLREHPAIGAPILHWLAESHSKARPDGRGILIPWAILCLGLLSAGHVRDSLPHNRQTLTGWLSKSGARQWRGRIPATMYAWAGPFWNSVAYGQHTGVLAVEGARLIAIGQLKVSAGSEDAQLRRKARALGGTVGSEMSDHVIASALGVEFA